jgi:hypothetical protein
LVAERVQVDFITAINMLVTSEEVTGWFRIFPVAGFSISHTPIIQQVHHPLLVGTNTLLKCSFFPDVVRNKSATTAENDRSESVEKNGKTKNLDSVKM